MERRRSSFNARWKETIDCKHAVSAEMDSQIYSGKFGGGRDDWVVHVP